MPRLRPLRYPPAHAADKTPVEKGIDVQLALGVAETILTDTADVAILFTHDTDLLPAVRWCPSEGCASDRDGPWSSRASLNGYAKCLESTITA